jgi:deoxycytidylate deaminase
MKHIYNQRKNFNIIGITGTMGSGCSKVAQLLATDKEIFFGNELLRNPQEITLVDEAKNTIYDNVLFQKKYKICYEYMHANWNKYIFIDYKKVLFLYCFDYFSNVKKSKKFENDFSLFILSNFKKANRDETEIFDDTNHLITNKDIQKIFNSKTIDIKKFKLELRSFRTKDGILEIKDQKKMKYLHDIFFLKDSNFNKLFTLFLQLFTKKNYYLRTLFFHRIACNIRNTGQPDDNNGLSMDYVYNTAKLINRLIKAYKTEETNKDNCHIVINSLKNSLEIMYFKERFSAFYMMAIHYEDDRNEIFNRIVKNNNYKENTIERLINLDNVEYRTKDFKKGVFSSPDIENCIQKSEIHIINPISKGNPNNIHLEFSTLYEQLIKYLALIQQPGIITPSNIERCMQIAFNSKSNSGCISRQVGAVITNQGYAVKSVGWNDTPKQTIPCLLRNFEEVINGSQLKCEDHTYSDFELPESKFKYKANDLHFDKDGKHINITYQGKNFSENVKSEYSTDKIERIKSEGKNCAYCFKALHNKFEGENNQVHTRSLHAEENAMLQVSKLGGQGLKNGFLFTTASPCELCSKKAYQLGIKQIFYIDNYPGISKDHIISVGFDAPLLIQFKGVVGRSFNKLYEPFLAYKDELKIYLK